MNKVLQEIKSFIFLHWEFVLGLVLTLSLLWPLFAAPFFTHHDSVQVIRLYEMNKCIEDGQIPCRWVPDLGGLYGYPLFTYYAPLAYYYGEIFYLLFGSYIIAAKIMFATGFVGSYIFMFLLARKLWGERGGALSGIFYIFAPYHALLFYVRGAMGELWGVMFFPALFWAVLRLKEKTNIPNLLLLSTLISAIVLSHNLSTFMFLPFLFVFALIVGWRKYRYLIYFTISFILGLFISAFYWIPAATEKSLVHVDSTISGYFYFTEHFKGLRKLFVERIWGWGASVFEAQGRKDGISFQIGWGHVFGWVLAVFATFLVWQKNHKKGVYMIFFSLATMLCIFMIHPRSRVVWEFIDPIKYVQFPWRFLGLIIFFVSLLAGSIFIILAKKYSSLIWVALVGLVVALNFSYFQPEKFIIISDEDYFVGKEWDSQIKRSIFDFLPIYAKAPPAELATVRYEFLTGGAGINDYQEGTNWFKFKADVKEHTIMRLSQYYFPNWVITVDGNPVKIDYGNELGLMTIILGKGQHTVEGRLYDTTVRAVSNRITAITLVIVIIIGLLQIQRIRRWISYYLRRIN